ncbi:MAG: SDR family oxidoreductase [Candidatus Marinimicrobia bacterium]|nr:SDR family oxidoreductase [Candidatus Neomarinimicrobiota bacterium]MCF7880288.1 SDR family oxidoreductase [Candidatus Neomarinimicrobiota bacterium]
MDLGLQGKCAFIAGASKGLGYATALQLAREGANVAICARTESDLHEAAESIRSETDVEVLTLPGDVSNTIDLDEIFDAIEKEWHRLDILVTNAGGPPAGTYEQVEPAQYRDATDLNLQSTIEMTYRALPLMKKHEWGRIIAITSVSVKQPIDNLILSNTARAGVVSFCKTLANSVGEVGITVNVVCPGNFRTQRSIDLLNKWAEDAGITPEEMEAQRVSAVPLNRYGEPQEMADTIAFLASERASYITGTSIQVDGGLVKGI